MSSNPPLEVIECLIRDGPFNCEIENDLNQPNIMIYNPQSFVPICLKHQERLFLTDCWTSGRDSSTKPRLLYGISKNTLLISRIYRCDRGCGTILGHDESILNQAPSEIPFVLFHRSEILKNLLSLVVNNVAAGNYRKKLLVFCIFHS